MKAAILACVIVTATLALPMPAEAATGYRLAVFGDDGTTSNTQANVNGALADGAQGYLGLGDYYYWSAPSTWKSMFSPLTSKWVGLALGNHDAQSSLSDLMPAAQWSKSVNGARIVSINTEARMDVGSPQYNAVRNALCYASESTRVLVMHKGWWLQSGARHTGAEFPGSASAMDQLVKDCGVDLVAAGHEHNYQRMVRNGVSYVVVGTGGQSLYAVAGSPSGTVASYSGYGRLLLDVRPDGYSATFKSLSGNVKDSWSVGSGSTPAPAPAPSPTGVTFAPKSGNEWWVQVKVSGATPAKVESMDTGGAWVALTLRSWGDWAGSYHVEPGHLVTFRATLSDGAVVTSCAYAWPAMTCSTSAPSSPTTSTYAATFKNARGNVWWVEVDVSALGLAGVDARVNGGSWVPLAKQSWGSWAKSMSAPTGSKVEFRARSTTGQTAQSAVYAWPP